MLIGLDQKMRFKMREAGVLKGHTTYITCFLFLPDGTLASSSSDKTIKIWDYRQQTLLYELKDNQDAVLSIVMLPNDWMASGSADGYIKIWDLKERNLVKSVEAHSNWITTLLCLKDGNLASCSKDNTIKIWNPYVEDSMALLHTFSDHFVTDWRTRIDILSTGLLVSCSDTERAIIKLWDPREGKLVKSISLDEGLRFLIALPNDYIALAKAVGKIVIYDPQSEQVVRVIHNCFKHGVFTLAQLVDNYFLSSVSRVQKEMKVWNLDTGELAKTVTLSGEVTWLAVSPDKEYIICGSAAGTIRLFSLKITS